MAAETTMERRGLRGGFLHRRDISGDEAIDKVRRREQRKAQGSTIGRPWRFLKRHHQVAVKILLVVLALFFSGLPIIFVNNAIGYMGLITVVFAIATSFVYLQVLRRSLSFDEGSLLDVCERGSEIEFEVAFKNSSLLIFTHMESYFYISDLFGGYDTVIPARMMLMPKEESDYHFDARFVHIGTYSAGVQKVVIGDLLGLFTATVVNDKRHTVSVVPRLFDIESIDLSNVSMQESRKVFRPIVTDDMDYAGVRDYRVGDSLKTVHWKLSARMGGEELYTRLFETFGNPGITTIVDPYAPAYDADSLMHVFDGLVESALSVNSYAAGLGMDAELAYLNHHEEPVKTQLLRTGDADQFIDDMMQVTVHQAGEAALAVLMREGRSNHGQGNIAFCTSRISEEIITSLIEIKMCQRNPLLFLVVPKTLEGDERKAYLKPLHRLMDAQIVYYIVESTENTTGVKAK